MKKKRSREFKFTLAGGLMLIVIFTFMSILFFYTSRQQAEISTNQRTIARFYLNWTLLNEELYAASLNSAHYYQLMVNMSTFESNLQEMYVSRQSSSLKVLQEECADTYSAIYIKWPYVKKNFNTIISELSYTENPEVVYEFLSSPLVESFEQDLIGLDRRIYRYSRIRLRHFQLLNNLIVIFLLLFLSGLLFFLNTLHQRQKSSLRIRNLTQSLLHVQEEEKKQIAYNLHDDIIQDLVSIKMQIENLSDAYKTGGGGESKKIKDLSFRMQELIQAARRISGTIRPYNLDHLGLVGAIRAICNDLVSQTGMQVQFLPIGMEKVRMDYTTRINLYRIAQEALQNVRKHSSATRVVVRLISSSPRIILRIKDNGRGFNPGQVRAMKSTRGNHLGLTSIEERTHLLSGELTISSGEDEGTEIKVIIPLPKADRQVFQ